MSIFRLIILTPYKLLEESFYIQNNSFCPIFLI